MIKKEAGDPEVADIEPTPMTKRGEPPVEAGEAPTGQTTEILPSVQPKRTVADLSGPQVAEIRRRNEDVDKAAKAANDARDDAMRLARMAAYAQNDLTTFLRGLQEALDLDPTVNYSIDLDRGQIVPVSQR